ncbi:MAG TPA: GtrA family protein [Geminicoccaceae bacterium]|nr:GtrA family protein [Geminicoccaceae bacterium]
MLQRIWRLGLQYARFGTIGLGATATNALLFVMLVELAGLAPLLANAVAFCVAVLVSFHGHFHWTFPRAAARPAERADDRRQRRAALARFVVVALIGLALNSLAIWAVVDLMALPYAYALIVMVVVVPPLLFILNKRWAFA